MRPNPANPAPDGHQDHPTAAQPGPAAGGGAADRPAAGAAGYADRADVALWQYAGPWAQVHRTRADLVKLEAALNTWALAKGLTG